LGRVELSGRERSRAEVMGRVKAGSLSLGEACQMLGISYRQGKRIWARYREGGAKALQHGNCGRVSNRAYSEKFRQTVLRRVKERYEDFGPTLAAEHLASEDQMRVHAETLRGWMKQAGMWRGQRRRSAYRQRRERKALRLAGIDSYAAANDYLEERYLAAHNRRYARPAASEADYHRRRPTARQLDEVFWLEEERVVSDDWVVRYKNRLLQLQRQSRHWAPAKSRVLIRENEAGQLQIRYRQQTLPFRELSLSVASARRSEGRGAAPSPAPPSPKPRRKLVPAAHHPWKQGYTQIRTPAFSWGW
jgi:transposase